MSKLDMHLDLTAILKTFDGEVMAAAQSIAANIDKGSVTDAEIVVRGYTTDRSAAAVSIAHPAGLAMQAKHGALTKAAAAAGFAVHG